MLEVCNIKKNFKNKEVLKDVSFSVNSGEIVCLLGNNGAGKTTIINCILKMMKTDSGKILFNNTDISLYNNSNYFSLVNALLESSVNIYDYLSGRQNIAYFAGLMKLKNYESKTERYIELLELDKDIDKPAGQYSRGMQQKLALVIALMSSPRLLLLDEPTLGLDIKSKLSVIDTLNKIIKTEDIGIILTTHQMDVVRKLNSKILLLKDGRVSEFRTENCDEENRYVISYIYNHSIKQDVFDGSFIDAYNQYSSKYEIIEIKKKEVDLEDLVLEALSETD